MSPDAKARLMHLHTYPEVVAFGDGARLIRLPFGDKWAVQVLLGETFMIACKADRLSELPRGAWSAMLDLAVRAAPDLASEATEGAFISGKVE